MAFRFRNIRAYLQIYAYLAKIFWGLVRGMWQIAKLDCAPVAIFGGSKLDPDSIYMKKARELGTRLSQKGIPVLTGGGPGIMEAASCGAYESTDPCKRAYVVSSIGVTVKGVDEKNRNKCMANTILIKHFITRKMLMIDYSAGFAIFPGGFGTLNEFSEILTLLQLKLSTKIPVVLIGKDYWKPIVQWLHDKALKEGLISKKDIEAFSVTDDLEEAISILKIRCRPPLSLALKKYR